MKAELQKTQKEVQVQTTVLVEETAVQLTLSRGEFLYLALLSGKGCSVIYGDIVKSCLRRVGVASFAQIPQGFKDFDFVQNLGRDVYNSLADLAEKHFKRVR